MMRPGASVIEITPYQFEYGRGSFVFSVMNSKVGLRELRNSRTWCACLPTPGASRCAAMAHTT